MNDIKWILAALALTALTPFLIPSSTPVASARIPLRELALNIARVTVNESGWNSEADGEMIWQIVRGHTSKTTGQLRWLMRHSACATPGDCNRDGVIDERDDVAASRRPNARWTRYLLWNDSEPQGWPSSQQWTSYVQRWREVRRRSWEMVRNRNLRRPCTVTPTTWGSDEDREWAIRRGYIPVVCVGTLNTGYRR